MTLLGWLGRKTSTQTQTNTSYPLSRVIYPANTQCLYVVTTSLQRHDVTTLLLRGVFAGYAVRQLDCLRLSHMHINTYWAMGKFSRQQIGDIFFLIFPRKQDLKFQIQQDLKFQILFSGKWECRLLKFLPSMLSVKVLIYLSQLALVTSNDVLDTDVYDNM